MYEVNLDENTELVLGILSSATGELGIDWFVCGAAARVLLCERASGMRAGRATNDLDIAVCVDSYSDYDALRKLLCDTFDFQPDRHQLQRLRHSSGTLIDIVPFGKLGEPNKKIIWGEDSGFEMSVLGFEEAFASSLQFRINEDLTVLVASYTEQFGLKLLAWKDRHERKRTEDTRDIAYFLRHADGWFSEEMLHDSYPDVLESVDYDMELAAVYALGSDLIKVFHINTVKSIISILERALSEPLESILIRDVAREVFFENPEERVIALLEQVRLGMLKKV